MVMTIMLFMTIIAAPMSIISIFNTHLDYMLVAMCYRLWAIGKGLWAMGYMLWAIDYR